MDYLEPNKQTKILLPAKNYNLKEDKRLLIPYTNGRNIGFVNRQGEIVVQAKYSAYYGDCYDLRDFIVVEQPITQWRAYNKANNVHFLKGIIDFKGEEIFPCEYERIIPALGNKHYLFTFEKAGKGFAVMTTAKRVIVPFGKYNWIDGYDKGLARVKIGKTTNGLRDSDSKWGLINYGGGEVLPVEYDDMENFYGKNKYIIQIREGETIEKVSLEELIKNYQHYMRHKHYPTESYKDFNTFEEFENTYAQREMGFSDEEINDAFNGEADAAWNTD